MNETCKICSGEAHYWIEYKAYCTETTLIYLCQNHYAEVKSLTDKILSGELIGMLAKLRENMEAMQKENEWLRNDPARK